MKKILFFLLTVILTLSCSKDELNDTMNQIEVQPVMLKSTNQFLGVNWADTRDNYVNGTLYVSGLSSYDTYSSAATVADRVVGQFVS